MKFRLVVRKPCRCLTFTGWLVLLLLVVLVFRIWLGTVCRWLSLNHPVKAKTLVVEGWIEDYALKNALQFYEENNYKHLIVTGLPITQWHDYVTYKNTAEGAIAVMKGYGFQDTIYQAVIPLSVTINRTYNTAVATRLLFEKHPEFGKAFNIYSVGVHTRRTHLLFERAFGEDYNIGILADTDRTFDPKYWWHSSKGFRNVSNEFVAFNYVWAFFHPDYNVFARRLKESFYFDSIREHQRKTDSVFKDSDTLSFNKANREKLHQISWLPVSLKYRIPARLVENTGDPFFDMAANTHTVIDFNTAYNLYCAFMNRWSRPLVPFEKQTESFHLCRRKKV